MDGRQMHKKQTTGAMRRQCVGPAPSAAPIREAAARNHGASVSPVETKAFEIDEAEVARRRSEDARIAVAKWASRQDATRREPDAAVRGVSSLPRDANGELRRSELSRLAVRALSRLSVAFAARRGFTGRRSIPRESSVRGAPRRWWR